MVVVLIFPSVIFLLEEDLSASRPMGGRVPGLFLSLLLVLSEGEGDVFMRASHFFLALCESSAVGDALVFVEGVGEEEEEEDDEDDDDDDDDDDDEK